MASLRARHASGCALGGRETAAPKAEREKVPGCTCRPVYSIRGAAGQSYERLGHDLRTSLRALAKRQVQEDEGEFVPIVNARFEEWAEMWLGGLERKVSTVTGYRETIRYANEAFGRKSVRRVTTQDVLQAKRLMAAKGLSDSTKAKHLRVLHACFKSAVRHGYAAQNPVERIPDNEKPRPKTNEAAFFGSDETPRILGSLPEGLYRTLCRAAYMSGLRLGELCALTWGDVSLPNAEITVRRSYRKGVVTEPKNRKSRTVTITPDLVAVLQTWRRSQGVLPHATALVFASEVKTGTHGEYVAPWEVGYRLKQAITKAGLAVDGRSFHSFRHSYAARALEAGASIFWLSRQLGHSSTQVTTEKYGHFEKRARRAEADKLAGAFGAV